MAFFFFFFPLSVFLSLRIALHVCACACFLNAVGAGGIYGSSKWFSIPSFASSSSFVLIPRSAFFFLSPLAAGSAAEALRQDLACITGKPCRDHRPVFLMCFFFFPLGVRKESQAQMRLRLVGCQQSVAGRPLLLAMKQIYRPPSGVSSGVRVGGRGGLKARIRMSCLRLLLGLPSCFLLVLCRMHATEMCRQLLIKVSACGPQHCQRRGI